MTMHINDGGFWIIVALAAQWINISYLPIDGKINLIKRNISNKLCGSFIQKCLCSAPLEIQQMNIESVNR